MRRAEHMPDFVRGDQCAQLHASRRLRQAGAKPRAAQTQDVGDPDGAAVIGPIRVVGLRRVDTAVVRNLLVSRSGRRYSQEELFESQRNLYESDLFRFATVNIDSASYHPGDSTVPLVVQVNESKTHRVQSGMGYATYDCFRGSLGWTTRDFLGAGRILGAGKGLRRRFLAGRRLLVAIEVHAERTQASVDI